MSHGPSTLGSIITSSLLPAAATICVMSSSAQGELSALMRVHRPVVPKSFACAISMKPARAASLASAGIASSRLPSTTSTCAISSPHLGADLLHMRRHEVDHALEPHRQLLVRRGRADRERLEEGAGEFHAGILSFGACKSAELLMQILGQ